MNYTYTQAQDALCLVCGETSNLYLPPFELIPDIAVVLGVSNEPITRLVATNYVQGTVRTAALTALYSTGGYSASGARFTCTSLVTILPRYSRHPGRRNPSS